MRGDFEALNSVIETCPSPLIVLVFFQTAYRAIESVASALIL